MLMPNQEFLYKVDLQVGTSWKRAGNDPGICLELSLWFHPECLQDEAPADIPAKMKK
jgi:hypothetical protein